MPVDYSKWDALELSDDSDFECHPNVDKKSFIRAKQTQIHQQRAQRKQEIGTLKYERIINDGLLERINSLLDSLTKHQAEAEKRNPDEIVLQALIESAGDPAKDEPPKPPEGVHSNAKEPQPRYSKMMGSLVDQVKKEVDKKSSPNRYKDFIDGVNEHLSQVQKLQQALLTKLAQLEKEEGSKITSESIHVGFDKSSVAKAAAPTSSAASTNSKPKAKAGELELLNPNQGLANSERPKPAERSISSGAEADVEDDALLSKHEGNEEDAGEDESSLKLSPSGKEFSKIKFGDYRSSFQYISEHPEIMNERTQDSLLVEAFNVQMKGKDTYARTCVHQALLIQYCRQLGRDGVALFFKRITTPGHQAQQVFNKDVAETYGKIKHRAAELSKEEADPAGVEQIQLHAVDPGTEIHINVPQAGSDEPIEQEARKVFERFPPGLQRALESGSLDEVNKILGKMSVEEAEEIVDLLGKGGMLSLEEGVIDATNEEGQQRLKDIEAQGKFVQEGGDVGEPGEVEVEGVD